MNLSNSVITRHMVKEGCEDGWSEVTPFYPHLLETIECLFWFFKLMCADTRVGAVCLLFLAAVPSRGSVRRRPH